MTQVQQGDTASLRFIKDFQHDTLREEIHVSRWQGGVAMTLRPYHPLPFQYSICGKLIKSFAEKKIMISSDCEWVSRLGGAALVPR